MIPLTATLRNSLDASVHELAKCWTIERVDGVVLRFTDHNAPLILDDGNTYSPAGGFSATAQQQQAGLQSRNIEMQGVLTSDRITEDDLRAGRYRGAKVTERVVNWRYPFKGAYSVRVFWVAETARTGETWTAQLEGLTAKLRQPVGRVYSRTTCWKRFGSTECGANPASFTATGAVASVSEQRLVFLSGTLSGVTPSGDGYFDKGELTFTSGANAGVKVEVKVYTHGTKRFELQLRTPFDIAPGDTFSVIAGCDKGFNHCVFKFSNGVRYGGYPYIPGDTKALQTPDAN